jgi:hypothetical protein
MIDLYWRSVTTFLLPSQSQKMCSSMRSMTKFVFRRGAGSQLSSANAIWISSADFRSTLRARRTRRRVFVGCDYRAFMHAASSS